LSGFSVEATQLGAPDLGVITLTELASHASRIADAVDIPIFADIDTGFGGALNVTRTIRAMESAGVAGVHIEDQAFPKRCPVVAGRSVVSESEAVERIRAAVHARMDRNFVIVARTDADILGFDEVVRRANLCLEAGADLVMPMDLALTVDGKPYEALSSHERMAIAKSLIDQIDGSLVTTGSSVPEGYTATDYLEMGYCIVPLASMALSAVANALADAYAALKQHDSDLPYRLKNRGRYNDSLELMRAVRLDEFIEIEKLHSSIPNP
jgi:methylisocitrate lyase